MSNKICYISIDFEEWYHIPFMEKYHNEDTDSFSYCEKIGSFVEQLNNLGIKATIFVVAELAKKHKDFLIDLHNKGNIIACHSSHHSCFKDMSDEDFLKDVANSKKEIEEVLGFEIQGYRAPMFSASFDKLKRLSEVGITFDSSSINSTKNPFYYRNNESLWKDKPTAIREYIIPTVNGFSIGGGGWFRAMPFYKYKQLLNRYLKTHDELVFFLHPYEICSEEFIGFKHHKLLIDRKKFNVGRKTCIKKFWKLLKILQAKEFEFKTMEGRK